MVLKVMNDEQGYVVKNIETFLNAIVHHDSIKYGKNFEFIHSEDAFDDDSLDKMCIRDRFKAMGSDWVVMANDFFDIA